MSVPSLQQVLFDARQAWGATDPADLVDVSFDEFLASRIEAAGWHPPARTVTTVEELAALPHGSVLTDCEGGVWQLTPLGGEPGVDRREWTYVLDGTYDMDGQEIVGHDDAHMANPDAWFAPLTVIHEPPP